MHERDLIDLIQAKTVRKHNQLLQGIGDDCGIFTSLPGTDWLITTDMLVEDVHFNTKWHSPFLLGRKSLAVNLSDIAAMAGSPKFVLLSLVIPKRYDNSWLTAYIEGFTSLLDEYNCVLIGGDTVSGERLTFSITVLGTAIHNTAVCRTGASPGDSVYVAGHLGSAAAGLYVCKEQNYTISDTEGSKWPELIRCHLDPIPQVRLGQQLNKTGFITAMQDISDGVATDLSHICQKSGVAGVLWGDQIPGHPELYELCRQNNLEPLDFQLRGGEDYLLLFTVRRGCEKDLEKCIADSCNTALFRIGTIEEGRGVVLQTGPGERISIAYQGYEHTT